MKLQICFALFLIASMAASVHGACSISELAACVTSKVDCNGLLEQFKCYERCGTEIPDVLKDSLKKLGCGASALTNIGLPMMLLVVLAVFYNK